MKNTLITVLLFCFFSLVSNAQHSNIRISTLNYPNEPSIALDPKNPRYIVAGANINSYYYSSDTGRTWSTGSLSSTYGVWGDPTIIFDTAGGVYFFHLSNPAGGNWIDRIVCQKSLNKGQTWNNGSYTGLNGAKAQDKQWPALDRKRNILYLTWTQFDVYGSAAAKDSSHIMFSRSLDAGATWSPAKRLDIKGGDCIDSDNTVEGAVPAVGPLGQLYVTWVGKEGLYFTRSNNGGGKWSKPKVISTVPGGWDYPIPGISRCNGLPITTCDISNGPNKGTIYINWSDQRNGAPNTDIWLIKSTDGGSTWSQPARVNDDNSNRHQFLTWMTVDQTNGYLYFVFYDRRNYTDNQTDVYMARSTDGGQTFVNFKISETPFTPSPGVFFGDYNNITAHNNVVRPIWTRMSASQTSIWTALINTDAIPAAPQVAQPVINMQPNALKEAGDITELLQYPNPFTDVTYVSFKIHATSKVSVEIFNNDGRSVAMPVSNKTYEYGKYVETIQFASLGLPQGVYHLQLTVNDQVSRRKVSYMK